MLHLHGGGGQSGRWGDVRGIRVSIVRFVDAHQPGWVECRLIDATGQHHVFIEKVPIVSLEQLSTDTVYPRPGAIACRVIAEPADKADAVTVDTDELWGVTSRDGRSQFDVFRQDLVDL
jgi:hypothetical protein